MANLFYIFIFRTIFHYENQYNMITNRVSHIQVPLVPTFHSFRNWSMEWKYFPVTLFFHVTLFSGQFCPFLSPSSMTPLLLPCLAVPSLLFVFFPPQNHLRIWFRNQSRVLLVLPAESLLKIGFKIRSSLSQGQWKSKGNM